MQAIFGTLPTVILDWYHLDKKLRELMSMIALNKTDKERHLAVDCADKHRELLGYLDKHRNEIIDYAAR